MFIRWLLGSEKNSRKESVVWNAFAGALNAGQTAILLVFISSRFGLTEAGEVTIGYALAVLFSSIGQYGVRNYQVTDIANRFSFSDYYYTRRRTVAFALGLFAAYAALRVLLGDYSLGKAALCAEIMLLKMIDAFEDVYVGRFQQLGRLDIGAKISAVRLFCVTGIIGGVVLCGMEIHAAFLCGITVSWILYRYLIKRTFYVFNERISQIDRSRVRDQLKACLPLCLGVTLSIYIGNAPKYMIDACMDESTQAIFGYIMLPVFVITLLNQFIYQPFVKGLGDTWANRDVAAFRKSVRRQCWIVISLTVLVISGGLTVGIPLLSVIYHVDLASYRPEFAVLLLGGGAYALSYYLNVPLTAIRKQRTIAIGNICAAVFSVFFGTMMVTKLGMMGAAVLYLSVNLLLLAVFFGVLLHALHREAGR